MNGMGLVNLGLKRLLEHKVRAVATALSMSMVFGLALAMPSFFAGVEQSYRTGADEISKGALLVVESKDDIVGRTTKISEDGEEVELLPEEQKQQKKEDDEKRAQFKRDVEERVGEFGGEMVGEIKERIDKNFNIIEIIPQKIVEKIYHGVNIYHEMNILKSDELAGLAPATYKKKKEEKGIKILGTLPGVYETGKMEGRENLLVSMTPIVSAEDILVIIDNGSARIKEDYTKMHNGGELINEAVWFESADDAYRYYNFECPQGMECGRYNVREKLTNQVRIRKSFDQAKKELKFYQAVLVVTGFVIMVASVLGLMVRDAELMAFYRTQGASRANLLMVCLGFLTGLTLMVLMATLVMAGVLGFGLAGLYAPILEEILFDIYGKKVTMTPVGVSWEMMEVAGVILLCIPIGLMTVVVKLRGVGGGRR